MKLSSNFFCLCVFFLVCACMVLTILTGTVINTYTVYRYPLRHLKDDHEAISILRSLLTDNTPCPGKVGHTTRVYVPCSFRTVVWILLRPTRTRDVNVLWGGTYGFSSLSELPVLPTKEMKKQWTLLNFSTRRVNAVLFGIAEVTFESVDEILSCDHSKESSSTVLSRSTIFHSAFSKIKLGIPSLSYFHFNHFWK